MLPLQCADYAEDRIPLNSEIREISLCFREVVPTSQRLRDRDFMRHAQSFLPINVARLTRILCTLPPVELRGPSTKTGFENKYFRQQVGGERRSSTALMRTHNPLKGLR